MLRSCPHSPGFALAGLLVLGGISCGSRDKDNPAAGSLSPSDRVTTLVSPRDDQADQLEITIETVRDSAVALEYSADGAPEGARRVASGVVISNEGHVLSVRIEPPSSSSSQIMAQVASGKWFTANWVAGDPETGLTLLRIPARSARPAVISPTGARLGMPVLIVGNPFGLAHSVGRGFVAGLNRRITLGSKQLGGLIQIDAGLHPGDSGAVVTDLQGGWLGVIRSGLAPPADRAFEAKHTESEVEKPHKNRDNDDRKREYDHDLGFAIPANDALWVANQLREHQIVDRAYLGITMDLNAVALPSSDATSGAILGLVMSNTPAERGGLLPGDRVIKLDNLPVRSPSDLTDRLDRTLAGSEVTVEVVRRTGSHQGNKRLVIQTSRRPPSQSPPALKSKPVPPDEVKVSESNTSP